VRVAYLFSCYLDNAEYFAKALKAVRHLRTTMACTWDIYIAENGSSEERIEAFRGEVHGQNVRIIPFAIHYPRNPPDILYGWRAIRFVEALFSCWEYDKVVVAVDDFYITSQRYLQWIENEAQGWISPPHSCWQNGLPEASIFVITRDSAGYASFIAGRSFHQFNDEEGCPEEIVGRRMTTVDGFTGHWFGRFDFPDPPNPVDWVGQVPVNEGIPQGNA